VDWGRSGSRSRSRFDNFSYDDFRSNVNYWSRNRDFNVFDLRSSYRNMK
jgi:hypothetical protein